MFKKRNSICPTNKGLLLMKFKNLNRPSEVRDLSPNPFGGKGEGDMTKEIGLEKDA